MRIFLIGLGVFCWGDDNLVIGIFLMRIARMGCEFFILIGLGVFCWGDDNVVGGIFNANFANGMRFFLIGWGHMLPGVGGRGCLFLGGLGGLTKKTALASRHERFRYKK